jgi:hypothetical protein
VDVNELEREAAQAHVAGVRWPEFYQAHHERVDMLDQDRRERVLAIVVSGDTAGTVELAALDCWGSDMALTLLGDLCVGGM